MIDIASTRHGSVRPGGYWGGSVGAIRSHPGLPFSDRLATNFPYAFTLSLVEWICYTRPPVDTCGRGGTVDALA